MHSDICILGQQSAVENIHGHLGIHTSPVSVYDTPIIVVTGLQSGSERIMHAMGNCFQNSQ